MDAIVLFVLSEIFFIFTINIFFDGKNNISILESKKNEKKNA
ncbi:hypothetical protein C900_05433 [Fulvivirga imtechensis AK7]|uniref:Uncharacterized protein n=1 Tax=Fulvivirga imtechensis AK7 TaxID=1237149 RepID=L8JLN4_9BACT|nr:hypothetical protein C900_05433 [Fulvivirga imtechensis AK7]